MELWYNHYDCGSSTHQSKGEGKLKITLNPDAEIVAMVKQGLKEKGGYCPCRREMNMDTKCMCKEFREQLEDPNFEGFCHCMLYYKSLED